MCRGRNWLLSTSAQIHTYRVAWCSFNMEAMQDTGLPTWSYLGIFFSQGRFLPVPTPTRSRSVTVFAVTLAAVNEAPFIKAQGMNTEASLGTNSSLCGGNGKCGFCISILNTALIISYISNRVGGEVASLHTLHSRPKPMEKNKTYPRASLVASFFFLFSCKHRLILNSNVSNSAWLLYNQLNRRTKSLLADKCLSYARSVTCPISQADRDNNSI